MARRWREGREEQARDIKETLQRGGMTEREASEIAEKRSNEAMRRAERVAIESEGERPTEIRSK